MDMERIKYYLRRYGGQALVILLGLVLVCSPDTASVFIARLVGWILILAGSGNLLLALTGMASSRVPALVWDAVALGIGIFIVCFPLVLAEALGRFFGLFLVIWGSGSIRSALQRKRADLPWQAGLTVACVTLGAGILLFLLPMTLSRVILKLCGLVLILIGAVDIFATRREQKAIEGRRPDIIDADD